MLKRILLHGVMLAVILAFAANMAGQQPARPAADGTFTLALTGDSIITQRLSPYKEPDYLSMIGLIRNADAAFTNLEMLLHDYEGFPSAQSGGTYMRADPMMAKELAWAGFDLAATANNHTGDYSVEAMRSTHRHLNEAGIMHAGSGGNLQEAREPRYLETAKGRVALISCASTFPTHSMAGRQRSDVRGRPGLNPLRFATRYIVDQATADQLRNLATRLRLPAGEPGAGEFTFLGSRFVVGDRFDVEQRPHEGDMKDILSSVRDARVLSDYVIVTIHAHESDRDRNIPPQFLPIFARAAIDAGADVFVGHGPHVLRGIEIYKGKPILYSLGDFIFQNDTVLRLPADNYDPLGLGPESRISEFNARRYNNDTTGFPADPLIWESVVAMPVFNNGKLVEMKLYPISLGFGKPSGRRGRPTLADEQLSRKIINDLIKLSEPFGTRIEYKDRVGTVKIPTS